MYEQRKENVSRRQEHTSGYAFRHQAGWLWLSHQIIAVFICYTKARSDTRQLPRSSVI